MFRMRRRASISRTRGYQFADGVYEVILVHGGRLVDEEPHLDRLGYSLSALPHPGRWRGRRCSWCCASRSPQWRGGRHGVSAGDPRRSPRATDKFPAQARPSLVWRRPSGRSRRLAVRRLPACGHHPAGHPLAALRHQVGLARCRTFLGKQAAAEAGAFEAWLVDDEGNITEGSSTNAWIVTRAGRLVTRNLSAAILSGITRLSVLQLLKSEGDCLRGAAVLGCRSQGGSRGLSHEHDVAGLASDPDRWQAIGDGQPGPLTMKLRDGYLRQLAALSS